MLPSNRITNALLAVIAVALTAIAARPYVQPTPVAAQSSTFASQAGNADPIYVEPGVYMLRRPEGGQVLGKVTINLRTGNVWGFPTGTPDPYPVTPLDSKPQISHAIPLGRFAVGEADR
ncbi:hypothetical protein Terro_1799 [Terriglobus roseus DSM 18391]|uniref:Uncharacterized protein n=1 Tax=Terriglobus roseus (strain DSM 18391 / NRRL B-41598 / KBS 63) TaxID=926566 RepID=I3ZFS4_TERRK|nr:hypothetical protein [Terriglobus roseus]AFL88092.1 hypothetical protein Terro_1799 [Terriglobus roseus DSM 18391]